MDKATAAAIAPKFELRRMRGSSVGTSCEPDAPMVGVARKPVALAAWKSVRTISRKNPQQASVASAPLRATTAGPSSPSSSSAPMRCAAADGSECGRASSRRKTAAEMGLRISRVILAPSLRNFSVASPSIPPSWADRRAFGGCGCQPSWSSRHGPAVVGQS